MKGEERCQPSSAEVRVKTQCWDLLLTSYVIFLNQPSIFYSNRFFHIFKYVNLISKEYFKSFDKLYKKHHGAENSRTY